VVFKDGKSWVDDEVAEEPFVRTYD